MAQFTIPGKRWALIAAAGFSLALVFCRAAAAGEQERRAPDKWTAPPSAGEKLQAWAQGQISLAADKPWGRPAAADLVDKLAARARQAHQQGQSKYGAGPAGLEPRAAKALAAQADEDEDGPPTLAPSQAQTGELSPPGDIDVYSFFGRAGQVVAIDLESHDFDAFVEVELDGQIIGANDDGGSGLNSLLETFVLPVTGEYLIIVHALGDQDGGSYTVSWREMDSPFVLRQGLVPGRRQDVLPAGAIHLYPLVLTQDRLVQIDLASQIFDAVLVLYAGNGLADRQVANQVAFDDDGGGDFNARIVRALSAGAYLLEARTFVGEPEGSYSLELDTAPLGPDEDATAPPVLAADQTATGRLFPAGDIDAYTLVGQAGQAVAIDLESDHFDAFVEMELDGDIIGVDDDGGTDFNSLLRLVLPQTGQYRITVRALGGFSGAYDLSWQAIESPFVQHPALVPGRVESALDQAGEVHFYPLIVAADQLVQIDLESGAFDAVLTLYRGRGAADRQPANQVAFDDDGGGNFNARIVQIVRTGNYLVEVRAFAGDMLGAYSLGLEMEPLRLDEDAAGPLLLAADEIWAGQLAHPSDIDRFRFAGQTGQTVQIALESDHFDAFVELVLDNVVVGFDDDGGVASNPLLRPILPAAGEYRIVVRSVDGRFGRYILSWSPIPCVPGDIDCNGEVDVDDVARFAQAFGATAGEPAFKGPCDLDGSGRVDLDDFFIFLSFECVGNRGHRFRLPFGIQLPCGLGLDRVGRVLCQYNR